MAKVILVRLVATRRRDPVMQEWKYRRLLVSVEGDPEEHITRRATGVGINPLFVGNDLAQLLRSNPNNQSEHHR